MFQCSRITVGASLVLTHSGNRELFGLQSRLTAVSIDRHMGIIKSLVYEIIRPLSAVAPPQRSWIELSISSPSEPVLALGASQIMLSDDRSSYSIPVKQTRTPTYNTEQYVSILKKVFRLVSWTLKIIPGKVFGEAERMIFHSHYGTMNSDLMENTITSRPRDRHRRLPQHQKRMIIRSTE